MRTQFTESSGTTLATEIQEKLDGVRTSLEDNKRKQENLAAVCERLNKLLAEGKTVIEGSPDIQQPDAKERSLGTLVGKLADALEDGPLSTIYEINKNEDDEGVSLGEAHKPQSVARIADTRLGPAFNDAATQVEVERTIQQMEGTVNYIDRLNSRLNQARYHHEKCNEKLLTLLFQEGELNELEAELNKQIARASANEPNPELQQCAPQITEDTSQKEAEEAQEDQAEDANTTSVTERTAQGASSSPSDAFLSAPLSDGNFLLEYFTRRDKRQKFLRENLTGSNTNSNLPDLNTLWLPPAREGKMTKDHLIYIAQVMLTGTLVPIRNYNTVSSYKIAKESGALFYIRPIKPGKTTRPNGYLAPDFEKVLFDTLLKLRQFVTTDLSGNSVQPFARILWRGTEAFPPTVKHAGKPRYPKDRKTSKNAGVYQFRGAHMNGYAVDCTVDTLDISGRVFSVDKTVPTEYRSNWRAYLDALEKMINFLSGGKIRVYNEYKYSTPNTTGPHFHLGMPRKFWQHNKGIFAVTANQAQYKTARQVKQVLSGKTSALLNLNLPV